MKLYLSFLITIFVGQRLFHVQSLFKNIKLNPNFLTFFLLFKLILRLFKFYRCILISRLQMTHVPPFFDSKSFDTYPYMTVVDQGASLLRFFLHLRSAYKTFEFAWLPNTAWKVSVFGVILVHIFSHSDWIRRDTLEISPYLVRMRENTDQNNS